MKLLFKILALISFSTICMALDIIDHKAIIQPYVNVWKDECISKLSTTDIITITDTILLSYQIVEASLIMSQARLVIQSELLNIVTLSINDTFDVGIQVQNNDFTRMKCAISELEQAQEHIKSACANLKRFIPLIISIDPCTIQILIANFKSVILHWVKTQDVTVANFEQVKQEFITNAHLFAHVNNIFQIIVATETIEHCQLLHGANSLTDMYKKIENTLALLTVTRQEGVAQLDMLLTLFFKLHYQVLYDHLQENYNHDLKLIATSNNKLLYTDQIFALA